MPGAAWVKVCPPFFFLLFFVQILYMYIFSFIIPGLPLFRRSTQDLFDIRFLELT